MHRWRAFLELRKVLAAIRQEQKRGQATPEFGERASQIVEKVALAIEPEPDDALLELIDYVRAEIGDIRAGRSGNR